MNEDYITVWHHPTDIPIMGTIKEVEACFKKGKINFELRESKFKDHMAFAVDPIQMYDATLLVERKFGRNV